MYRIGRLSPKWPERNRKYVVLPEAGIPITAMRAVSTVGGFTTRFAPGARRVFVVTLTAGTVRFLLPHLREAYLDEVQRPFDRGAVRRKVESGVLEQAEHLVDRLLMLGCGVLEVPLSGDARELIRSA